jgi:hypothetical protein
MDDRNAKTGADGTFPDILSPVVRARALQITIVNLTRHLTQRGNVQQFHLASNAEHMP